MRRFLGLALAAALWLGYAPATNAQMVMGYTPYTTPYVGGVVVGAPVGVYPYAGLGATYYRSGYSGVGSPLTTYYGAPAAVSTYSYPVYGYPYVYRRGLLGRYRLRAW